MALKILIVEDDNNIADLLRLYLEKENYEVSIASDGGKGVEQFRRFRPDLVLLDLMLPVLDGWGVCRTIRAESQTPVIMLTAKSELDDKVAGLKYGADDYITKPFEMKEVLARIEAVLRRSGNAPEKDSKRLVFDKLIIDMDSCELTVDGKKIPTPPNIWPPRRIVSISATSCWTRSGASIISAIPAPWMFTSSACGKSWRGFPTSGL